MKKIILSVATLSAALAQAQVGINQETPKATLDISVKKDNIDTNSQEGLLIPRVTKEKALKMANSTTAQPEESALIYVNDVASFTSAPDEKVNDITEKGYYFWNGTKWVKSVGSNGELWAQDNSGNAKRTYLVPANESNVNFSFKKTGDVKNISLSFNRNDGGYPSEGLWAPNPNGTVPAYGFTKSFSSDILPFSLPTSVTQWAPGFTFESSDVVIGGNHANSISADIRNYRGKNTTVLIEPTVNSVRDVSGVRGIVELGMETNSQYQASNVSEKTSTTANTLLGATFGTTSFSTGNVNKLEGTYIFANNYQGGEIGRMVSLHTSTKMKRGGKAKVMQGIVNEVITQLEDNGSYSPSTVDAVVGLGNTLNVKDNTTVTAGGHSARIDLILGNNTTSPTFSGIFSMLKLEGNAQVGRLYGNRLYTDIATTAQVTDMYGIYIDNVKAGADKNYAIYTKTGDIRFGDLVGTGERLVTANDDGVLATSNKSLADLESLWANDDTNNLVKLKATSDGTPRVSAPGASRNDVTIDDSGKITAKGFIGYNGATIFPDYVFEKYYTGESTIKADYNFHNLASVEKFIKTNGHLPGYKSAKEIASKGLIDLGATQLTNVEKIEELYLYTIEQEKELKAKDAKIEKLENELNEQKMRLERLEKLLTK